MTRKPDSSKTFADLVHNPVTAWIVLAVSLGLTVLAWWISSAYVESRAQDRFDYEVDKSVRAIAKRMEGYEQVLRGVVGLFEASDEVTRLDFERYVANLQIDTYWPGIQGIGYAEMLAPAELEAHQRRIRAQGFPNYAVNPAGEREVYSAIVYLEPFDGRNLRAFGYDMYSNPVRREAMQRSADSGLPALSGRVTLVQETDRDIQAGFLVYLPYYRLDVPLTTAEDRRAALQGFVYSPFRARDLMRGILGDGVPPVDFRIYDGDTADPVQLLYDSFDESRDARIRGRFSSKRSLAMQGRTWTIEMFSHQGFDAQLDSAQPSIIALGGLLVDILLFAVILSIARNRKNTASQAASLAGALDELGQSEQRLKRAHEIANVGSWYLDLDSGRMQWSDQVYRIFGLTTGAPVDFERFLSLAHAEDRDEIDQAWQAALTGIPFDLEHRIVVGSDLRWVNLRAEFTFDEAQRPVSVHGSVQDITERKRSEQALHLGSRVFQHAREGIMITDAEARIVDVNPMFNEITGYTREEVIGRDPSLLASGRHDERFFAEMYRSLEQTGQWHGDVWNRRKNGQLFVQHMNISAILEPGSSSVMNYIGLFSDVTESRNQQDRMEHMAHHDSLTGLPNRFLLQDRLNVAIARAGRDEQIVALLYIDLDEFKPVNDAYGHAVGDRVLVEVGRRLELALRAEDTVARLGGDEFAVLITGQKDFNAIVAFAERLLESLASPYLVDDKTITISASIGIALLPHHAVTADKLMISADQAMYQAKSAGRNVWRMLPYETASAGAGSARA